MAKSDAIERVRTFISNQHIEAHVRILPPESTKTSHMAAQALGCTVAEIAKTIGFITTSSNEHRPILVTLSGASRVSIQKLADHLSVQSASLRKMSPDEVKSHTGYSIGGVPPFPHNQNVRVFVDESVFQFAHVWAAAGTNNSVMRIEPSILTGQLKMPTLNVSE